MKRPRFSLKYALVIIVLAILAYMIMTFSNQIADLQELTVLKETMALEATRQAATATMLETRVAYATSDLAAREWALSKGDMVEPGVVPVFPLAPTVSTPVPTPVRQITPTPMENWEMWLWLFVDRPMKSGGSSP